VVDELPNLNNKKLVELRKMVALLGVGPEGSLLT